LDVSTRCGEIDVLKKLALRYVRDAVPAAPTLGATGAGVVLGQSEWNWIGLMVPMFHRAMQIPCARLQICLWFEKLIQIETGDLIFPRPFVGRSFAHLHQPTLSMAPVFFWIESALTPNDGFHHHRIQMMFQCNAANEPVIPMKSGRAHPFIECVKRVPRFHCDISKRCCHCQQCAENQFEEELYHSTRATITDYKIINTSTSMNDEQRMRYVRVVVDRAIHRELDYSVPETLAGRVGVGSRVRVPFREKSALATVVALPDQSEAKGIRPVEAIIGEAPILSEPLLELARWIGTYYCCPIETVMRSMLPQVIRRAEVGWKKQLFVQPAGNIDEAEFEKLRRRAPRQAELLEAVARLEKPVRATELLRQTSLDNQTLRALVKRGLAELREEAVVRD